MRNLADSNTASASVDIVVVTYDNKDLLNACIGSIQRNTCEPHRIIVVNNGGPDFTIAAPNSVVLKAHKNLGWMGGVNLGVKWAKENNPAKFILWMNDDTQILDHDYGWLTKMVKCFELSDRVGAVGPTSNAVMGYQSIAHQGLPPAIEATRLSGLCFLTKQSIHDEIGYLDETLPGGDDLDYSIRMRKAGYKLAICRRSFILHHYASTGKRVHGEYWDSREHTEKINAALIAKHGFKPFFYCVNDMTDSSEPSGYDFVASEEKIVMEEIGDLLDNGGKVLDLGCGGKKIDARAVGVDIRKSGQLGVGYNMEHPSACDMEAEVTRLPMFSDSSVDGILAKHLLEHIEDVIEAVKEWGRVLKDDGRLVIVCPDPRYCEAISCDPSHLHAFTPSAIESILKVCGFKIDRTENVRPGYVGIVSARKIPVSVHADACAVGAA